MEEKAMQMIPVRSSAITAVGYDVVTRKMKITFKQGRTYGFCGQDLPLGISMPRLLYLFSAEALKCSQ